ncbi:hypothetical protein T07_11525 [Trichinella nelsoni]|uniref:Uncharacterized protein n=1 Tax=Trichinella nelsoni TaxID=6336 RepID=A0A0V0RBC7_9BILA|nr:hypothetical protein T07_11525 [Trichinella nelsoni]
MSSVTFAVLCCDHLTAERFFIPDQMSLYTENK